jgi:hypothetical protein
MTRSCFLRQSTAFGYVGVHEGFKAVLAAFKVKRHTITSTMGALDSPAVGCCDDPDQGSNDTKDWEHDLDTMPLRYHHQCVVKDVMLRKLSPEGAKG